MRFIGIAIANLLLIIVLFTIMAPPAFAQTPQDEIGIPFVSICDVSYAMPASFGGIVITEFNSTALSQNDFEDLAISFEPLKFSVIPSDNDLDLPHIRQNVDASISYQDTYFYTNTFTGIT